MLAPRHLIFSALEGALIDPRTDSFSGAEEALSELERRKIAYVLLTSRTREQVEPIRRKLGHNHPSLRKMAEGFSFSDGYFSLRIPGAVRTARYLSIAQGRPYAEVCEALDEIAEECAVGVAGFHHMSLREIADNTGLRPRSAELARAREFDEPFYFTSASEKDIARFVEAGAGARFRHAARPDFLAFFRQVRHREGRAHPRPTLPGGLQRFCFLLYALAVGPVAACTACAGCDGSCLCSVRVESSWPPVGLSEPRFLTRGADFWQGLSL